MTNNKIIHILKAHSIPYRIDKANHIFADDMLAYSEPFESETDVTCYTKTQLYAWLGY